MKLFKSIFIFVLSLKWPIKYQTCQHPGPFAWIIKYFNSCFGGWFLFVCENKNRYRVQNIRGQLKFFSFFQIEISKTIYYELLASNISESVFFSSSRFNFLHWNFFNLRFHYIVVAFEIEVTDVLWTKLFQNVANFEDEWWRVFLFNFVF